jgi:beta-N-acetylhexosaminidase
MDLFESPFSATSNRVKHDAEAQEWADAPSLQETDEQSAADRSTMTDESVSEKSAEGRIAVQISQATRASIPEQTTTNGHPGGFESSQQASANGQADDVPEQENEGDTPGRLPAVKAGQAPATPFRPPMTPRKHVIPSRRPTFDTARPPAAPHNGAPPTNGAPTDGVPAAPQPILAPAAVPDQQPVATAARSNEPAELEANLPEAVNKVQTGITDLPAVPASPQTDMPGAWDKFQPHAADLPTRVDLPAASAAVPAGHQADLPIHVDLSVLHHDTSAAEEAWRTADADTDLAELDTHILAAAQLAETADRQVDQQPAAEMSQQAIALASDPGKVVTPLTPLPLLASVPLADATVPVRPRLFIEAPTTPLPAVAPPGIPERPVRSLARKKALLIAMVLVIILINASATGFSQFFGPQGWGSTWSSTSGGGPNLLTQIAQQLAHTPTAGSGGASTPAALTPAQVVALLLSKMSLDEKLGQMMMVQFVGQSYSTDLSTMINQYHVGSVLYFQFNIGSKSQLSGLNSQMQHDASLPLLIAVDQEGGTVDRLINLDGAQPSASQIGASGNPKKAYQQGVKDAKNLAAYGFNLNLAPVVDVNNVYNWQLQGRTYGSTPTTVSEFAEQYLTGLQQSGKVLGTLKHFPGLGDVSTDPHYGLPALTRSLSNLNAIDWAPYRTLINQGHVYSIMVTHEIVDAVDKTQPSSLSPKVIGILRNQLHFQGVIITDSLTMDSIHNF